MLAAGVLLSGYVKDLLCLPRPLSPPLQRISRSASVALEYGFPSTHSTNSVSVAVYVYYMLQTSEDPRILALRPALQGLCCFYAITIVMGRLYCGMHGFFDVLWGLVLGLIIAIAQCLYGEDFDNWIYSGPFSNVVIVTLVVLVLVRMHPEPADDCPCFDDSVSFSAVFIGLQIGAWQFVRSGYAWDRPVLSTVPFDLEALGWTKNIARIILGILLVFTWRGITKPTLLKALPPLFRVIEQLGLSLPRKFFLSATSVTNDSNI